MKKAKVLRIITRLIVDYWLMIIDWTKTKTKTITITKTGLYGSPQADLFCGNSNFHELDSNWKKLVRKRTCLGWTQIIVNYPWIYRELIFLLVRQKGTILHPHRADCRHAVDWWMMSGLQPVNRYSVLANKRTPTRGCSLSFILIKHVGMCARCYPNRVSDTVWTSSWILMWLSKYILPCNLFH